MYPRSLLFMLILVGALWEPAHAQFMDRIEIGVYGGGSTYIGDLNEKMLSDQFNANSWTFGAGAKRYFNRINERDRTWGIRFDVGITELKADESLQSDLVRQSQSRHFKNKIIEGSLGLEFHFYDFRPHRKLNMTSPYVVMGMGLVYHNPKDKRKGRSYIGEDVELRDYEMDTDGQIINRKKYPKFMATGNVGVGIKRGLSGSLTPFSIGLEVIYKHAFTDFLDGHGHRQFIPQQAASKISVTDFETLSYPGTYPYGGASDFDELVSAKHPRGQKGNDRYLTTSFRVTYTFYRYRDPLWK